jgi:hypothetical protein
MLTKKINGSVVTCSESEEALIRAYWALNDQYPLYWSCCLFDGVSAPFYDASLLIDVHKKYQARAIDQAMKEINTQIEVAQENAQDTVSLIAQRKTIRAFENMDFSQCQTPADLIAMIPEELEPYWPVKPD